MARAERPTQPSKARRRRRRWPWLGFGLLGLLGAWLLPRRPEVPPRGAPAPRPIGPPAEEQDFELPTGGEISWIAGPGGALRLWETHRDGGLEVLFLHGLGGRLEQWAPVLRFLGSGIRAVALDLPGHGESDRMADDDYSVPRLATAVQATISALGLRRPVLVAHDLGASAALEIVGQHPRRFAGLLLVDPNGDQSRIPRADRQTLQQALHRDATGELEWTFRQLLIGARPPVAERVLDGLRATPDEVLAATVAGALAYSPLAALERYDGPLRLLLSPLNDLPYSLHRLRPALPARRCEGGHWPMLERPEALWEELVDFLDEVSGAPARG